MNLYVMLGVGREATTEELKRAYRRLARKYHPDINPGDQNAAGLFRQITDAYETLSDPDRRRRYDALGDAPHVVVDSRFEFAGFDFSRPTEGDRASTFGELFSNPSAAPGAAAQPERGADLHTTLTLTFEEAVRGVRRAVTLTRLEACGVCSGRGRLAGPETRCEHCDGAGEVRGARGHMVFSRLCPACAGVGQVRHRVCGGCGGEGVGVRSDTVWVDVPAGVSDGQLFSVPGEGHAGRRAGPPGDLRVTLHVLPHRYFRRMGDDVHVEVPLAIHEAALGGRIEVPGIDGAVRLRVPPGTQSGQTFRVRGRGIATRDGARGDLVITVRIVLPSTLDERSKALLREFGELNPGNVRQGLER